MTFPLPLTELNVGIMVALDLIQGVGAPPAGYAWVTTQGGSSFVTTNNGADRVAVKVA